ncbi:hypothetical protein FOC1_g10012957 [Fusarium oxysporum f. sp. cubense race 1]|uniref:Uncharacterized protein n=1 Tax=Fusarium oxysporum f. sp. cubense (strain race 1) TaxID=1229664 RepID=N4TJC5_FUSC1|nr:hypothetical protein FOC1_g10012957 [Fusarium oxysporum f. sp. cubense race 1]
MFHGAPGARSNLSDWDGSDRTLLGYGAMTGDARLGREYGTATEASEFRLQDSGSDGGSRTGDDIVMSTTVTALLIVYNVELQRID